MSIQDDIKRTRERRAVRVHSRVRGTSERPRLSVFRSNRAIWAQVIDDSAGRTLASAGSPNLSEEGLSKAAGVERVVFDRGSYLYHGRVKALADGAREGGLDF
jgi:large subunit ribosomal protein L18